jgi:hypothetical protein
MMPFIPTPETFLSLALCGSIRDKIVPPPILADYLLYHLNLKNPELYTSLYNIPPTNNVSEFLTGVARKSGRLVPGGYVDEMAAAIEVISRFRRAGFGTWPVDRVTPDAFDIRIKEELLARQRETRGTGGKVVKNTTGAPRGISEFKVVWRVVGGGPISVAIARGRQDAKRAVGRGGKPKKVMKRSAIGGGGFAGGRKGKKVAFSARGVRKAVNRNKGATPRKKWYQMEFFFTNILFCI